MQFQSFIENRYLRIICHFLIDLYLFFPSPETRENEVDVALSEMTTVISILLNESLDCDHLVFLNFLLLSLLFYPM